MLWRGGEGYVGAIYRKARAIIILFTWKFHLFYFFHHIIIRSSCIETASVDIGPLANSFARLSFSNIRFIHFVWSFSVFPDAAIVGTY